MSSTTRSNRSVKPYRTILGGGEAVDFRDTPHVNSSPPVVDVTELSLFVPCRNVDLLARLGSLLGCGSSLSLGDALGNTHRGADGADQPIVRAPVLDTAFPV